MIVPEYGNLKLKDRTSRTNLLFSLEKMALCDAVRTGEGGRIFALGLLNWLYGDALLERHFDRFVDVVASCPANKPVCSPGHWSRCSVLSPRPRRICSWNRK